MRAEHVEALLRGVRQPVTAQDKLVLDTVDTLRAWPPPVMRPEFHAALRARLLTESLEAVIADEAIPGTVTRGTGIPGALRPRSAGEPARHRVRRLARPTLVGALASSVAVLGVTLGARHAMPGDTLYGVKRQVEQIQVTLAGGEAAQAEARLDLARTRMDEVQALVDDPGAPMDDQLPGLFDAWQEEVHRSSDVLLPMAMHGDTEARSTLEKFTDEQSGKLADVCEALADDAGLKQAAVAALDYIETVGTRLHAESLRPTGGPGTWRGGAWAPTPFSSEASPVSPPSTPPSSQSPSPTPTPVQPGTTPTAPGAPTPLEGWAPTSTPSATPNPTVEPSLSSSPQPEPTTTPASQALGRVRAPTVDDVSPSVD